MTVYIAAPYTEKAFATLIARGLQQVAGIACSSRWLTEDSDLSATWAQHDLDDLDAADVLIALNAETWANRGTGGRHVELGYAIAHGKPIVLVGVRSNIFHYLPQVHLLSWHDALNLSAHLQDVLETLEMIGPTSTMTT